MENVRFENISFDYYDYNRTYIDLIIDMLPEKVMSKDKKIIILSLYKEYLKNCNVEKIEDVKKVSRLLIDKIMSSSNMDSVVSRAIIYYEDYLEEAIFNSEYRNKSFDDLLIAIKNYTGYNENAYYSVKMSSIGSM